MENVKYKLIDKEMSDYEVYYNGEHIGNVYRAWSRVGGNGWKYRFKGHIQHFTYSSRKEVTKMLINHRIKS
jgi:hypothetical protein